MLMLLLLPPLLCYRLGCTAANAGLLLWCYCVQIYLVVRWRGWVLLASSVHLQGSRCRQSGLVAGRDGNTAGVQYDC